MLDAIHILIYIIILKPYLHTMALAGPTPMWFLFQKVKKRKKEEGSQRRCVRKTNIQTICVMYNTMVCHTT